MMVNVAHREFHCHTLAGFHGFGFAEAVAEAERHDITTHQHLIAVRTYVNEFHDDIRIKITPIFRVQHKVHSYFDRTCDMDIALQFSATICGDIFPY